jgi:hypothetical protein
MEGFLSLRRYPFTGAMLEYAPEEKGVYGLFDGDELIYLGATSGEVSIKACLLLHQVGTPATCTRKATTYTWEITLWPRRREMEIMAWFRKETGRAPRCQGAAA